MMGGCGYEKVFPCSVGCEGEDREFAEPRRPWGGLVILCFLFLKTGALFAFWVRQVGVFHGFPYVNERVSVR